MANSPFKVGGSLKKRSREPGHTVWYTLFGCSIMIFFLFIIAAKQKERLPVETVEVKPRSVKKNPLIRSKTNVVSHVKKQDGHSLTYRDEKGVLRYKNGGARAFDPGAKTRKVVYGTDTEGHSFFKKSIFKNVAENEIARLITLRPGDSMIGTRRYDEHLENEFRKSLETPIIVSKDDSLEDAELKRSMIAVKIEICDRLAAGEKFNDILVETRSELQRLARVKRNIHQEVLAQTSGIMDHSEVQAYIDAANVLLEKEGVAPIKGGTILRRNLILGSRGNSHEE